MTSFSRPLACGVLLTFFLGLMPVHGDDTSSMAETDLVKLHKDGRCYDAQRYKLVRAALAKRFLDAHQPEIDHAFADDREALFKWLDSRPDLKDDLFTAIDEKWDKIPEALTLFRELWKQFPAQLDKYPQLGIAVAVTWDSPQNVYNYAGHARRAGSSLPDDKDLLDGIGNFRYLVENEKAIASHWKFVPWEFLVFVVDHQTPLEERRWAQNYATHVNPNAKKWYSDVPYDHTMLDAEMAKQSKHAKLMDRPYTLANLKSFGGVCAHQADFTSRVGKSLGVPGYYCTGATDSGVGHAWWMYVQLHSSNAERIQFSLESVGRYQSMNFYTGSVTNPQTGRRTIDRDLERQLTVLGNNRSGTRQARLLMRAYPWLAEDQAWSTTERVQFLDKCLRLCPLCDEAWVEFARLVKAGELTESNKEVVREHVNALLTKYALYPDFVARMLTDVAGVFPPAEMVNVYTKAATQFGKDERPDLLCDVQLRVTDLLVAQKKHDTAFTGLVNAINRFPLEGRYIPHMTKKLQEFAPNVKDGTNKLSKLYLELVPKLVAHYRKDKLTKVGDTLVEQALDFFAQNQMSKQADMLKRLCAAP